MTATAARTANPAPIGLLGFGLTTILLNLHNAGFYGLDSMIVGMGIFLGGAQQVIAGIMEWRQGNTFGTTAFTAYGFFWLSLVALWLLPLGSATAPLATNGPALGFYLAVWGLFTLGMFVGTLRMSRALQVVFGSLVVLFGLLAAAKFTGSHLLERLAGFEGILCGASAFYLALAQVLNEVYGRILVPVGSPKPA